MNRRLRSIWRWASGRAVQSAALRPPLLLLLLVLLACIAAAPARADSRALLVGVSDYPTLPAGYQRTPGARNDVELLRQALRQRGFAAAQIRLLADGVAGAGLPTRDNILRALDELADASLPGDVVFLHFAGHGSREPGAKPADGASPIFLPIDIGRWDGGVGRVDNAVTRNDLRERVDRITGRGAFVWGVFDICHAASFVRQADQGPTRRRFVNPAALGVPPAAAVGARGADGGPSGMLDGRVQVSADRGGTVFFYAAQAGESAVELPLPRGAALTRQHGLLSFHVATVLQGSRPMSYRQLGQSILMAYVGNALAYATPVFSGNALDHLVLGQRAAPVWQWPLRMEDGLHVDAGSIFGLVPGAVLAVVEGPTANKHDIVGHLRVVAAELGRSTLEPVARAGKPAPEVSALRAGQFLRLVESPPVFALRVAYDARRCAGACSVGAAVARLRQTGFQGVDLQWADGPDRADVVIRPRVGRVDLQTSAQRQDPATDDAESAGLELDPREGSDALALRLGQGLHAVARSRNLLALAMRKAGDAPATGLTVLVRREGPRGDAVSILRPETVARLSRGDVLTVELVNTGTLPLDVTVLHLDAHHGVRVLYPNRNGESNRLPAGTSRQVDDRMLQGPAGGLERLLIIARQARAGSERSDFSFLAQPSLVRVRATPDEDLSVFADAAFAEYRRQGLPSPRPPRGAIDVQLFTFVAQAAGHASRTEGSAGSR